MRDKTADAATTALKPFAVPIAEACRLLGKSPKARSSIYDELERGTLEAVKDGARTLIVLSSIERRQASLPPWSESKSLAPHRRPRRTA